ncbi:hypothetical protein J2W20_000155 [Sinomonas atrocyanea]|nr:hypothetical protein [Sinomonas atrocyanea]MDR6620547.1 hypothetical protein [Sinomonas atrocyanea]
MGSQILTQRVTKPLRLVVVVCAFVLDDQSEVRVAHIAGWRIRVERPE